MDIPILRTKLYIPQAQPEGLISRSRLTQRLNEGLTGKLTLISAPAGSGKTTLVSQWLAERLNPVTLSNQLQPFQIAWLSLDEGDNDPVRFWTYVIAALESVQAGIGANALPLLHSPQPSPIEVVLTLLLNDLTAVPNEVALILDDYHLIENSAIHPVLTFLIDRLPPQIHLIITSRVDPPLPLARWRVRRQLTELRAEALRFTPDETAQFLNQLRGLNLSPHNIAALEARTEGWIAGLQLAALSLQGRIDVESFIAAFTGTYRYILDYMTEEILYRQSERVQTFLLQTSILARLTGSLCNAVTGQTDGQEMLEHLNRANLFIISLDEQGYWYRYHHLFADLLRHHLRRTTLPADGMNSASPRLLLDLHQRAAVWYEQAGWVEEAIHHAIAAEDFERVGRLILHNARTIVERGGAALLLRWFKALPETWLQTQLKLSMFYAWLLFFTGHLEEVQRKLAEFEVRLNLPLAASPEPDEDETFKNQELPGLIISLQAQIALINGDLPRTIELSQQALAYLAENEVVPRGVISHNLALAYWMSGESEKANRLLADSSAMTSPGDDPAGMVSLSNMAELKRMQGQNRQAYSLYQQILQLTAEKENLGLSPMTGVVHTEMGHLLYEWNDLAAAEAHLRQGIKLGNQGAGFRALTLGYMGLFRICLAQQKFDEALEIIHQAEQLAAKMDSGPLPGMIRAMWINFWLAQGNLAAMVQWVQANRLAIDDEFDTNHSLFTYIFFARVLLVQGELQAAATLLARLLALWESAKHTDKIIEILVLQAITFQAQHNLDQAMATLQRALILAEPEGYVRVFVDQGAPIATLLTRMQADESNQGEYIHKLLAAFGNLPGTIDNLPWVEEPLPIVPPHSELSQGRSAISPLVVPLTRRELEVLQLLTTGLSGQEIADKLVISRSTLKVHLKRIYDKLEVKSRAQAVVKGKDLRLI